MNGHAGGGGLSLSRAHARAFEVYIYVYRKMKWFWEIREIKLFVRRILWKFVGEEVGFLMRLYGRFCRLQTHLLNKLRGDRFCKIVM